MNSVVYTATEPTVYHRRNTGNVPTESYEYSCRVRVHLVGSDLAWGSGNERG